jgi:NifU-like protein involved in Fe-S cluster formation
MTSALYTTEILRLAASIPYLKRLDNPDASVEKRSATCGSRVTVDLSLDDKGCVSALGLDVKSCAMGQASTCLFAKHAMGRSAQDLSDIEADLSQYLKGQSDVPVSWPGLHVFEAARDYPARHSAIRLVFEAGAQAAQAALEKGKA